MWPDDGLPDHICQKCTAKLHVSYQFKKLCEKSDSQLRQHLLLAKQKLANKISQPLEQPYNEHQLHHQLVSSACLNVPDYTIEHQLGEKQVADNILEAADDDLKCKICGKQYPNCTKLNRHISTHSTNPPFRCDICTKDLCTAAISRFTCGCTTTSGRSSAPFAVRRAANRATCTSTCGFIRASGRIGAPIVRRRSPRDRT